MLVRRSPRAVLAFCGALVVALATARTVASDLAAIHRRATTAGDEVDVLVATSDLRLGATVAGGDVTVEARHEGHLPPGALRPADDATGRVVAVPVVAGSVITDQHLAEPDRRGVDGVVPPGMRAVHVVLDDAARLRRGAVVDVLVSFDPASVAPDLEPTTTVVEGALVLDIDEPDDSDITSGLPGAGRSGVTVLTDVDGAHRLAFAAANGIVSLALAPPEEACCPIPSSTSSSASSRD